MGMVKNSLGKEALRSLDFDRDFLVYYQEKRNVYTHEIVGAEALARYRDPTARGLIRSPAFFIPVLERTDRILELDFFVLDRVCRDLRSRLDAGKSTVPISSNFARRHFQSGGFCDRYLAVLDRYAIPRDMVQVEVTETQPIVDEMLPAVLDNIARLQKNGVRVAIDDFGTGYSSMVLLQSLPIDMVKLDGLFLSDRQHRQRRDKILRGMIATFRELGIQVVCEYVETEEDEQLLRECGIPTGQGYLYSRPVPACTFHDRLDAHLKS